MSNLPNGALISVPELPGRWSVWSPSDEAPGAVFVIPANDEARASGVKYACIKAIQKSTEARPDITVLRTDPAIPTPTGAHP